MFLGCTFRNRVCCSWYALPEPTLYIYERTGDGSWGNQKVRVFESRAKLRQFVNNLLRVS